MNGGITIRKRKLTFILYDAILLTGIVTCLFALFLLFLLFCSDINACQKEERGLVYLVGFWTDQSIKDTHRDENTVNISTSKDKIEFESTVKSTTPTSPNKVNDHQTSSPSDLDQQLLHSYQKNTTLNVKEIDPYFIQLMAIHGALQSYKEDNHHYPESLHSLTVEYPNNYLSAIPEHTHYTPQGESYVLSYKGHHIFSNQKEKMELHFYPSTNDLVVSLDDIPLARYRVASGKDPLPFKESKIEERVMNPNGGEGPVGTRGLVLQDHYAIHGTNSPSSIGHYITLGCIRLLNENIELLYSYISVGTLFKVKEGNSPSPVFSNGLPAFNTSNTSDDKNHTINETTTNGGSITETSENTKEKDSLPKNKKCECNPDKTFHWRG